MRILGIESSCDDTGAAVVEDGCRLLGAEKLSSVMLQRRYGGVVPEVAAREHALAILPVVQSALELASLHAQDVDAIAVTQGPGLLGALLVGVTFAQALGLAWGVPVIGVHHLEAHLYANALVEPLHFPALVLVVSGGHTTLGYWTGHGHFSILGQTRDDAAGEALDKGARFLGLPYPGGPEIEKLAHAAPGSLRFQLPVAALGPSSLDFSFSGLKTAFGELVRRYPHERAEAAWALQEALVEALCRNLERGWVQYPASHVYLAGGVAANGRLAERVASWGAPRGVAVHIPPPAYCTDNAAMVAALGYYRQQMGNFLNTQEGPKTPWPLQDVAIGGVQQC